MWIYESIHLQYAKNSPPVLGGAGVVNFTSDFGIFIFVLLLTFKLYLY